MPKHPISDQGTEVALGFALLIGGSWLLYDAYERRGHPRPWWTRLAPGP